MSYLKTLGLAVFAAGALMAFIGAGTASATELTCTEPAGVPVMCPTGTMIHAESEGTIIWHPPIGDIECKRSTITAHTTTTGGPGETVKGNITEFTLGECNAEVVVLKSGSFEIHTTETNANHDGTVTWTGLEMTTTFSGFHCIFSTNATDIGDLTGSTTRGGGTPTFDLRAKIPRTGGRSGAFCGSTAEWTGSYSITEPMWMDVD